MGYIHWVLSLPAPPSLLLSPTPPLSLPRNNTGMLITEDGGRGSEEVRRVQGGDMVMEGSSALDGEHTAHYADDVL